MKSQRRRTANAAALPAAMMILFAGAAETAQAQTNGLIPPYETPIYSKASDDGIVFGSLLEASGYSRASNTAWVGVAAGSFCGGAEKELILGQNQAPNFSFLRGPAPYRRPVGGVSNLNSSGSHPWRAMAAGNLDGSPEDEMVAVRQVTAAGVPDLVVVKVTACSCTTLDLLAGKCESPIMVASAAVGDPGNSDWVGAAVGNFDGTGKKIALLKTAHSNLFLVKLNQGSNTLTVVHSEDLPKDGSQPSKWKALAAADIDDDGMDELIAARQESDNKSPTVFAFKWDVTAGAFHLFATSTFGNDGNSNWASAAGGDFNADGRQAVVLVKDKHSNFAVMDLPVGATALRTVSTDDLDSAPGQTWTGLAATDWLQGDQGASELIAVRAVHSTDRTNIFVYGNPFHRVQRDTGLAGTKAQWSNWASSDDLKAWIQSTHTNTFLWLLTAPGDYKNLVQFLHDTMNWGVDGKQLRVWLTLVPPRYVVSAKTLCSQPEPTPALTTWNALDFFKNDYTSQSTDTNTMAACRDTAAWGAVAGRLAKDFPHLVGVAVDDFSEQLDPKSAYPFTPDSIADLESNMRSQAPWMSFSPFVYYPLSHNSSWADLVLSLDSVVFFFRNDKAHTCIGPTPDCDQSVQNAPGEIADIGHLLPRGRKMQLGEYWVGLWGEGGPNAGKPPMVSYDYNLTHLALTQPMVGGVVAYGLQTPGAPCDGTNFLQDRFCGLQAAFGQTIGIAPLSISFGQLALHDRADQTVVITNLGTSDVNVSVPSSPSPKTSAFSWSGGNYVVSPGKPLSIEVSFSPNGLGLARETLQITGNCIGSPYNIVLTGTGVKGVAR